MKASNTIKCLNGDTVEALFVRQHLNGRLFFDRKGTFYVVDNDKDEQLDMDVVELTTGIKPFNYV